ncbi:hypothetical protein [Ancylobacter mangrovi]|nr:hypothetical protein [Ancylobacter mangrovi]MCS0501408.1 hypothetical protein [Ancylobacter mangrovi]
MNPPLAALSHCRRVRAAEPAIGAALDPRLLAALTHRTGGPLK